MQARLDQLLTSAVDAWCVAHGNMVNWSNLIGAWRGCDDLLEFASAHPNDHVGSAELILPNCVVIAEYARRALGQEGDATQIDLLRTQCQRVLNQTQPDPQSSMALCSQ